ncbi:MAG: hypothetical protein EU548_08240, partial [Promethearchaeota archaeon]
MDENASIGLVDELYSTIQDQIHENNLLKIKSYLDRIAAIEEKFILTYTKRKKEGGYYTAERISRLIISEALVALINKRCDEAEIASLKELERLTLKTKSKLIALVSNMTICDPSCGSGVFLVNAANALKALPIKLGKNAEKSLSSQNVL